MSATFCLVPLNATGQSANITFTVRVAGDICAIQVLNEGRLDATPNLRVLDSRRFGGLAAQIRITSRRTGVGSSPGFQITFDPPTEFAISPPGTGNDIDWRVWHEGTSITDGINFTRRRGFRQRTLPATGVSVTQVAAHLRARRNDGIYPEGAYRAVGTYRCE